MAGATDFHAGGIMALRPPRAAPLAMLVICSCADRSIVVADHVLAVEAGPAAEAAADGEAAADASSACNACTLNEICLDGACKPKGNPAAVTLNACGAPPCINVYNNCPIPLFIHPVTDGTVIIDQGRVTRLAIGEQLQYGALPRIDGGRIYAYYKQPDVLSAPVMPVSPMNQFVEMSVNSDAASGNPAQNYNISYVDYAALPVSVQATGSSCKATICGAPFADWKRKLLDCPTVLKNQYDGIGTCMGSYNYCITTDGAATRDSTQEYCTKMQTAYGYPGSKIYGGVFPEHGAQDVAFWDQIAAYNRGTYAGNANWSEYFVTQPYNDYARWVHRELGCQAYAFSTDDHQNNSGFVRCISPQLDVVFCPYD
jgi:hypothetical protein